MSTRFPGSQSVPVTAIGVLRPQLVGCNAIDATGIKVGVGDGVGEGVGDGVGEGVGDGVGDGVRDGVGDAVGEGVSLNVGTTSVGDGEAATAAGCLSSFRESNRPARIPRISAALTTPTMSNGGTSGRSSSSSSSPA